jgi:hypothetical protein
MHLAGVFIAYKAIIFIALYVFKISQKKQKNWGQIPIQDNYQVDGQLSNIEIGL